MSNMFSSRKVPLLIAAGVLGGMLYVTAGANQQPRPRARADAGSTMPVSETLQTIAGTGGARASDTRVEAVERPEDAPSKRNADKVT
ncbi:hypothetical protein BT67DRAFT_386037 [Trichocladium antarcticum]|uniref:Uncharacterized protein n=1 Tax=Trichocladium antarcticum TaxID=1450529 RepID=A0AAN6UG59_9PEZI|nr:hypothetical protein BT67DRAFT_386037 [Trichocladium antarcticum]